jgi:cold shock CspA family protein
LKSTNNNLFKINIKLNINSMAKSMTVGKRENEKKRLAKREEKLKKKESKKLSGSSNSFEDMIAYVDENGMITSTPPTEDIKKEEINPDEIIIATPKKEEEEPTILRGRVEFFNESRGFGFIKDLSGVEKYFFHVNNVIGNIAENNIVTFDLERGVKGMNAINISLENKSTSEDLAQQYLRKYTNHRKGTSLVKDCRLRGFLFPLPPLCVK